MTTAVDRERLTAVDPCEDWCAGSTKEHEEYGDAHGRVLEVVEMWGSDGLGPHLFVSLVRPYVGGLPLAEIKDRHTSVNLAFHDDEPLLEFPAAVARSLAAALLRAAERAETAMMAKAAR